MVISPNNVYRVKPICVYTVCFLLHHIKKNKQQNNCALFKWD